ncbi:MAG: histidine kinase, partial [bacterium]
MKSPNFRDKIFSNRKRLFWLGHSLFWIMVTLETTIVFPNSVESFKAFLLLLIIGLEGYLITYFLRIIYKKYLWHRFKILALVVLAFIYSLIGGMLWAYITILINSIFTGESIITPLFILVQLISFNYTTIFLWSCLYLGYKIWEEWNNQKLQLEKERALLRTSQLEALKYQLNPHFLFNTLNSARTLVRVDPPLAQEMLTQISEFLRYSLSEGKKNSVPLAREAEAINTYLDIEKIRFKDNLMIEYQMDPRAENFEIPVFLILPLVENAIKHGMKTTTIPLKILLKAEIVDGYLQIEVANTGKWIESPVNEMDNNTGTGLQNVRKRLENSYPGNYHFEIIKEENLIRVVMKLKMNSR